MTIAWKLFYFRTSRDIRSSTPRKQEQQEEEENNNGVLDFRRRDRHKETAVHRPSRPCEQQGTVSPFPPRHPLRHSVVQQEREPVVLERRRTSEHGARNSGKSPLANVFAGRTFDDRLPGSVMEARDRLTERLRGSHLAESRSSVATTGVFLDIHGSVELDHNYGGKDQNSGTALGFPEETFAEAEVDQFRNQWPSALYVLTGSWTGKD